MAMDPELIADLRRLIGDTTEPYTFTDEELAAFLEAANGDVEEAASAAWLAVAAKYSKMVDITEAGSSRKNSQLFEQALKLAQFHRDDEANGAYERPRTRKIVRG